MQEFVKRHDEPERRSEPCQDPGKTPDLPVEERGETVRLPAERPEAQRRRRRMRATPPPARPIASAMSPASPSVGTGLARGIPA
jgi:hypothetical protein